MYNYLIEYESAAFFVKRIRVVAVGALQQRIRALAVAADSGILSTIAIQPRSLSHSPRRIDSLAVAADEIRGFVWLPEMAVDISATVPAMGSVDRPDELLRDLLSKKIVWSVVTSKKSSDFEITMLGDLEPAENS